MAATAELKKIKLNITAVYTASQTRKILNVIDKKSKSVTRVM